MEKALEDERGRVDRFVLGMRGLLDKLQSLADQVAVSNHNAAKQLLDATSAVSTTITDNITNHMDESWKAMKSFTEKASTWLVEIDGSEGSMAVERAKVVAALGNHVEAVVDDAKLGLEDFISKHLAAAHAKIAAAVTRAIAVPPPPPPPQPTPAFPDELMKSFKADVLKAVTEATQQSFVAPGLKLMTEVIGNVAAGPRASWLSANDADPAQRREADKQGRKRGGGGDDAGSVKRSKGADGGRDVGAVGPGGSRTRGQSVVDQLKKNGAKVIRSHNKGDGNGSADGGHADEVAAQDGGKGLSDKEIPTAQTAIDGSARTVKGPSVGVAGTTSIPRKPPAASSAPVGPSAANNDGPALVATPAAVGPSTAKGDAKDAAANRDGPSASKVPAAANALKEMLHRMEAHRKDVQQPPLVDAAPAKAARRTVTPQVAATTPSAPHTAPLVAAHPTADPKSALLRARLGARIAAAPAHTRPEAGSSATPTSVNEAAEKGVRAALATGGGAVDHTQALIGHKDADIAAIQNLLESVKRPGHPAALAISDTAHVVLGLSTVRASQKVPMPGAAILFRAATTASVSASPSLERRRRTSSMAFSMRRTFMSCAPCVAPLRRVWRSTNLGSATLSQRRQVSLAVAEFQRRQASLTVFDSRQGCTTLSS
ncbi:unnamed protein product [Closterium sp. NIES-53]